MALTAAPLLGASGPESGERAAVAHLLAFGRPLAVEATPPGTASATVTELVQAHRGRLANEPARQREVAARAHRDAFGVTAPRAPAREPDVRLYAEWMQAHVAALAADSALYRAVITRAYERVVGRAPYEEEFAYWGNYDALPYVLLVGAVEHWARRNQPGLMVTTGRPTIARSSAFLQTLPLSPSVAAEAREVVALPSLEESPPATGRNLVAVGGAQLVTSGRMHLAVVGQE